MITREEALYQYESNGDLLAEYKDIINEIFDYFEKRIDDLKQERDDATVKLYQTRASAKCFRDKEKRTKKWSDSMQSAVNQSGKSEFIRNLTEKIYLGRDVTKIGCGLCNPGGSFHYGMDENCERCGGSGFVYIGFENNKLDTKDTK